MITDDGRIRLKNEPELCLIGKTNPAINQVQMYGQVEASSTLVESNVDPAFPLTKAQGNRRWESRKGQPTATYTIRFTQSYMVQRIKIVWGTPPSQMVMKILDASSKKPN